MRVLITGGAGFIGSHLADAYLDRGDEVFVLDDLSTGSIDNIRHLRSHPAVPLHDRQRPPRAVGRRAGRPVRRGLPPGRGGRRQADRREPGPDDRDQRPRHRGRAGPGQQEEEEGARRLDLRGLRPERPRSRSARTATWCWGRRPRGAGATPARRRSTSSWPWPTGARRSCRRSSSGSSTPSARGRPGSTAWSIPTFVKQALAGRPITVYGDGTQSRCFTHVGDVVGALVELMDHPDAVGQVFNIGSNEEVTIARAGRAGQGADRVRTPRSSRVPYEQAYDEGFEDMPRRVPDIGKVSGCSATGREVARRDPRGRDRLFPRDSPSAPARPAAADE